MKKISHKLIVVITLLLNSTALFSQSDIWQDASLSAKSSNQFDESHYFDADVQALRHKLNLAPNEVRGVSDVIELPMPDGSLANFSIVESSIMEDGLAEEFPQIKSYKVYGIDDPTASGRVDISPTGFRGMLMTSQGRVFIDPVNKSSNTSRYETSFRTSGSDQSGKAFQCGVHTQPKSDNNLGTNHYRNATLNRIPGTLVVYRLAVSATSEYVAAVGGTLDAAMAEINTAINRVNQVYERDLGVRLVLVVDNSSIIETGPDDFGFSNDDEIALLGENQTKIDEIIGTAKYDIGHIFSTSEGGVATSEGVCDASSKAQGVSGLGDPTGDAFYIDFVAHEIGHQFGANHTWNASDGSCTAGNHYPATAFEPGSGSTIMSYSGICGAEDIATSSDATFHAGSIAEMNAFITGSATCGQNLAITPVNSDPTSVNAGIDRTIPSRTAFRLTGGAVDVDDTLTYQWDQMDAGTVRTTAQTIGTDQGNNPLFRSYSPQPTGIRDFPTFNTQVNGTTLMLARGETLPTTERILNFRLTVRDGRSGQGTDDVAVSIIATGPFQLTSPSIAGDITANTPITVTWDVAGTSTDPVNCAEVDIALLTFSADGSTYAVTDLLSSTLNDGSHSVTIPNMNSSKARFSIGCSDNIFYDISDDDQNIVGGNLDFPTTGNSINNPITANFTIITTGPGTTTTTPTDSGGGLANAALLTFLLSLLIGGYWLRAHKIGSDFALKLSPR
jgi:hypothetical protein